MRTSFLPGDFQPQNISPTMFNLKYAVGDNWVRSFHDLNPHGTFPVDSDESFSTNSPLDLVSRTNAEPFSLYSECNGRSDASGERRLGDSRRIRLPVSSFQKRRENFPKAKPG